MKKGTRLSLFVLAGLGLIALIIIGSLWLDKNRSQPPETEFIPVELGPDIDDDGDGYSENDGDCDDLDPEIYPGSGGCSHYCAEFTVTTSEIFWIDALYEPVKNMEFSMGSDMGDVWCIYGAADLEVTPKHKTHLASQIEADVAGVCGSEGNFEKIVMVVGRKCNTPEGAVFGGSQTDEDGDGYCEDEVKCVDGSLPGDCNDLTDAIHPSAVEVCDGLDNDCDGLIPFDEFDRDGDLHFICEGDCNDWDATKYPGHGCP